MVYLPVLQPLQPDGGCHENIRIRRAIMIEFLIGILFGFIFGWLANDFRKRPGR